MQRGREPLGRHGCHLLLLLLALLPLLATPLPTPLGLGLLAALAVLFLLLLVVLLLLLIVVLTAAQQFLTVLVLFLKFLLGRRGQLPRRRVEAQIDKDLGDHRDDGERGRVGQVCGREPKEDGRQKMMGCVRETHDSREKKSAVKNIA